MRPVRIFAALGPGDIVGAHRESVLRGAAPTTSLAFSEQIFNYCKATANPILAISSHPRADNIQDGPIHAENQRKSNRQSPHSGLRFHLLQLRYALYLAYRAWRFRADVALIDSSTSHYFALTIFRLVGIPVVVNLHNVLWPQGFPPTGLSGRVVRWLNAQFFRWVASGAIGVSPECERQVLSEARQRIPFYQYRCQFNRDGFFVAPGYQGGPFHVAFVGRVEVNKGALDLVSISDILANKCAIPVVFHVCGDGAALGPLRNMIRQNQLENRINIHGHLKREELLRVYSSCHAVIVPTTSTFPEGMPQVCAEAAISRLPIVASRVTNALDVLGAAIAEAETNNSESYAEQLCRLASDPSYYEQLRSATDALSLQFFDRSYSYPAAVDRMLSKLFRGPMHINDWGNVFRP